jgi:hypothetical protein
MEGGEQQGEVTHREFGIALATPFQFRRGALLPRQLLETAIKSLKVHVPSLTTKKCV